MQLITEMPYIIATMGLRSRFSSKVGLALMSARSALIDITTAGVCSGMYLMMHVGRLSLNAPWIIPTSRPLTVTGAPESPG